MEVQLFRIDDRLIHGQVVIAWVNALNSKSILLCDDSVYENDWEKELYQSCAPDFLKIKIMNVDETIVALLDETQDFSKTIILVNGPEVIEKIVNRGVQLHNINVGGIHFREGRDNLLTYLYLDDAEKDTFKRCMEKGVHFECLDVPTGNKVKLESLIN